MAPRRHLSDRQVQTVQRLVDAARAEIDQHGYDVLTVRLVAKRAGVTPATAYTYFDSKEHLVGEVYWRRYESEPATAPPSDASAAQRITDVLLDFTLCVANESGLAAASTIALLSDSPEVRALRARIGAELHRRLVDAGGDQVDRLTVETLELATSGALLKVGTGHLSYDALPDLLRGMVTTVLGPQGASR